MQNGYFVEHLDRSYETHLVYFVSLRHSEQKREGESSRYKSEETFVSTLLIRSE